MRTRRSIASLILAALLALASFGTARAYDGTPVTETVTYQCAKVAFSASATISISAYNPSASYAYQWYFYLPVAATHVIAPPMVEVHYTMAGCQTQLQGFVTATPQQSAQHEAYYDLSWNKTQIGTSYPWTDFGVWGTTGVLNPGL